MKFDEEKVADIVLNMPDEFPVSYAEHLVNQERDHNGNTK